MSTVYDVTLPGAGRSNLRRAEAASVGIGDVLGRYRVVSKLGAGAMGTVFRAHDPDLERDVALKVIRVPEHGVFVRERYKARLRREARALASLHHDNVVTIYDVAEADGRLFLAMELIEGKTLRRWLEDDEPPFADVIEAFIQAARGLAAAHAKGVVHRDFKPENVMIERPGTAGARRVVVMDFGLARVSLASIGSPSIDVRDDEPEPEPEESVLELGGSRDSHTQMAGTPAYMAPERLGREDAGPLTDQFSFCVSLYEAVYGLRPYSGGTVAEITAAIMDGRRDAEPEELEGPSWLRDTIARGLARDPAERWPSMALLADALQRGVRPTRRRGWLVGLAATTMAAAAVAAALARPSPCADDWSWLADTWSPGRQVAVRDAFQASGARIADETWPRVRKRLDGYASALVAGRVDVCTALERAEVSPGSHDLRMRCFERRRTTLREMVNLLSEADVAMVERAVEAVNSLPSPEACVSALPGPELPSDPAVRGRIEDARVRLSRANALSAAGRYEDAKRLLESVASEVTETGYDPAVAEVALERGRLAFEMGEYRDAREYLEQAYFRARVADASRIAHGAATKLVEVVGWSEADPQQGELWAKHAMAEVERIGEALPRAQTLATVALMKMAQDEFDEAIRIQTEVVEVFDRESPGDLVQRARARQTVSITQMRAGKFAEALQTATDARTMWAEALGSQHPMIGVIGINIGSSLLRLGRREEAITEVERSIELLGEEHPSAGSAMHNLGVILLEEGKYDDAARTFLRARAALERVHGPDHPDVLAVRSAAGVTLIRIDPQAAAAELEAVLDGQRKVLGAEHSRVAITLTALADAELERQAWDDALQSALEAQEIATATVGAGHPLVAESRIRIARAHEGKHRWAEAVVEARAAVAVARDKDPLAEAEARFVLGRNLVRLGNADGHAEVDRARATFEAEGRGERVQAVDQWRSP